MNVARDWLIQASSFAGAGSTLRLVQVTVFEAPELSPGTGSMTVSADGVHTYEPLEWFANAGIYVDSYVVTGCVDLPQACGTFRRVLANCTVGNRCPGGSLAYGNTDLTLCDSAPVYQREGDNGPVLFRLHDGSNSQNVFSTPPMRHRWLVGHGHVLTDCANHYDDFLRATQWDSNPLPPDTAHVWEEYHRTLSVYYNVRDSIHVVAANESGH